MSSTITIGGSPIFDLGRVYSPFSSLVAAFRSSGRFIWPLHYLIITGTILASLRALRSRPRRAGALLAAAVALQVADAQVTTATFTRPQFTRLQLEGWELAAGGYQHLALFPMQVRDACPGSREPLHVIRYMFQAYRLRLTFNSGYFARVPVGRVREACAELARSVERRTLEKRTIYVVAPEAVSLFKRAGAVCAKLEGEVVCVASGGHPAFREYLLRRVDLTAGG
jgi:hypothetical protein